MIKKTQRTLHTLIVHGFRNQIECHRWNRLWSCGSLSTFTSYCNQHAAKEGKPDSCSQMADYSVVILISLLGYQTGQSFMISSCLRATSTESCVNKRGECALFDCQNSLVVRGLLSIFMSFVKLGLRKLRNSPLRKRQKCDSTWDNINITVVRFPDDGTLDVPIVLPSDKNNIGNCQSTKKK